MGQKTAFRFIYICSVALCCFFLASCSGTGPAASASKAPSFFGKPASADDGPVRDSAPHVRVPAADGTESYGTDTVRIDASHSSQGYVMVQYLGDNPKVKLQITPPDGNTYTYLLSQNREYETFPLSSGDGGYTLTVLENVEGNMYSMAFSQDISVSIEDEFLPFLYPNQYVFFTPDSMAVAKGEELVKDAHSDLEAVELIYHYVIQNITYDTAKAESVAYGYLPDVDDTLRTGTGICFDYASVMSAMLRSQSIPARLEIGYAGDAYHSWISVYIKDVGWIDNIIEFDGKSWSLMDPTFAAGGNNSELKKYIGSGDYYTVNYYY